MTGVKNTFAITARAGGEIRASAAAKGVGWAVVFSLLWALAGCGPMVANAPFSSRPETLDPGDLLGPYDGQVIDAETERPLAEALISASWAFERGLGAVAPAGHHTVTLLTTPDGRYELPRLANLPAGASTRVARFTMVVYRRGYKGWRSDQTFPEASARRDFSQRRSVVRLSRWRDGLSHARHLAFLGGSPAIQGAAAWERQPAARELRMAAGLGDDPQSAPEPTLLDASTLLSEADVRLLNGYELPLRVGRLPDLPRSEFYDSVHFQAEAATSERDDVALRLWRLGPAAAEAQYRTLLADLPEVEARGELADASVRVVGGEVRALVFLVREPGIVVSVTCGEGQCPQPEKLVELARLVLERLPQLAPTGSEREEPNEPGSEVLDPFAPQGPQANPEQVEQETNP